MSTAEQLREAVKRLKNALPKVDQEKAEQAAKKLQAMLERSKQPGSKLEGLVENPFSASQRLQDLRGLLIATKDVVVPAMMAGEIKKLEALATMVENGSVGISKSE